MIEAFAIYAGLFAAALLAATILPLQSEAVLVGLLLSGRYPWWLLIAVASVGNTLGSVVNWLLGRFIAQFEDRRWFPVKREAVARAETWYRRYGYWSLLLSWAPFIGDPLTVVAGVLREPLPIFVLLVAVAKTVRYIAVAAVTFGWM
ncbi:MAG: DedA family protein [Pseudomonadota bacterium]|nr:DedA family protein [Pseudomonadota bacterium]